MGKIRGQLEYERFIKGDRLSYKKSILALCYMCNGFEESNSDCKGTSCPVYPYHPYKGKKRAPTT